MVLRAGDLTATFLPECGMLGISLTHRGDELVALPRSIDDYRNGGSTGMPLLHPWANRLRPTDLRDYAGVPTDRNGLPIHGTMRGRAFAGDERAASFDFGAHPDLLRTYPFPHVLTIRTALDDDTLTITTTVRNTGTRAMPVSFGWHPFFTLPGAAREQWRLRLPCCRRHVLDEQLIPTGETIEQPESDEPIGERTYDDHFSLGDDRRFELSAAGRTLTVHFDDRYASAQIYLPGPDAPLTGDFICIEPMTAAINALVDGTTPMVVPGDGFSATFSVTVR